MRALVSIGTYEFPAPSIYNATVATIVDSARNVKGYVIGSVIRDDVAKVEMSWNFITVDDWAAMLAKFSGKRGGNFYQNVTFFCADTGQWETREMYISDRTSGIFLRNPDGTIRGLQNAKFSLIEV